MEHGLTRARLIERGAGLLLAGGSALAGACAPGGQGGGAQPPPTKSGTVRAYLITNDPLEGPKYFDETVFGRFMKQFPNVKIEPSYLPYGETMTKVQAETVAGTAPDLFGMDGVLWAGYGASGAAKDLSAYVNRDARAIEGVKPAFATTTDPKGRVWAFPVALTASALAYNRALFDRFGVTPPDSNLEWNPRDGGSFLEIARRMTRSSGGGATGSTQSSGAPGDTGVYGFWLTNQITADTLSFLHSNGGSWLDKTQTRAEVTKSSSLQAFEFMVDLINKHRVSPSPADARLDDKDRGGHHWLFLAGRAAMINFQLGQESAWSKQLLDQGGTGLQIEVVQIARGPVGRKSGAGASVMQMSATSKQPDLAWDVVKWWYNDLDAQVGVFTQWKYGLPVLRKAWTDPRVERPSNNPLKTIKAFTEPWEKGWITFHEINPAWVDYIGPFSREFGAALRGEQSAKAAMDAAQPLMQQALDTKIPASWR